MIMAWLWNSMLPEISDTCMFLATAKDIWDLIHKRILKLEIWLKYTRSKDNGCKTRKQNCY